MRIRRVGASVVEDFDEDWCPKHTDRWHVLLHESAHAIAAADFGLEVGALVVHTPETAPVVPGQPWKALAEVRGLTANPKDFVAPDPALTLRYFLVGRQAEAALLGDELEESDGGDVTTWARGVGAVGTLSFDELGDFAGVSVFDETVAAREWATANAVRIEALATHIDQQGTPCEIPFVEVKQFLDDL